MWDAQSVLLRFLPIFAGHLGYDPVSFLEYLLYPPCNSGSSAILLSNAYSTSCARKDSLASLTWFQVELPSLHCMQNSHPLVVSLLLLFPLEIWIKAHPSLMFVPSLHESMMASNNTKHSPYCSTWENKLLAVSLAVIAVLYPSACLTSYILVSGIGLSAAIPIGLPSLFFNILLNLAN